VDDPVVVKGGTVTIQSGNDPKGMNRYIATGADAAEYTQYINNTLADRQPADPSSFQPALAVKVTTPDEGLSYEVTLRSGVRWHEPAVDFASGRYDWLRGPHALTSDDFKFVFDMLANPQVSGRVSALRPYVEHLDRFEVLGPQRFRVVFKERRFITLSFLLTLMPMPRWLYAFDEDGKPFDDETWGQRQNDHWYNDRGIGVGPFRFLRWEAGVRLEFLRNEDYWGEAPAIDRIVVRIIKDQSAWPRLVKTGELTMSRIQPEQFRTEVLEAQGPILGSTHIKTTEYSELNYFYIGWNMDGPYFSDVRVRQAMTLALDRAGIVNNVFLGMGEQVTGPFPPQVPCYDRNVQAWPYDLAQAKERLAEAGWVDSDGDGIRDKDIDGRRTPFEFNLVIYGSSNEWASVAGIFREALLQIGVKMNPQALEWSTLLKRIDEKAFDGYSGAWVLDWETDLQQLWHSAEADRPKSSNRIGFRSAEADRIIEALAVEFDPQRRLALCHSFHRLVHEEQPYTFLYARRRPVLYWDYFNKPEYSLVYPAREARYWSFAKLPE
jgi:ABC-type transport system substrate-binding protein